MRIAMGQIDPFVGDLEGNTVKICGFIEKAKKAGAELVIFPELSVVGYPPRDLLDRRGFVDDSMRYWDRIATAGNGIGVIFGAISVNQGCGKPYHNSALFYEDGKLRTIAHKMLLPSYDVFDEERFFEPGKAAAWLIFEVKVLASLFAKTHGTFRIIFPVLSMMSIRFVNWRKLRSI